MIQNIPDEIESDVPGTGTAVREYSKTHQPNFDSLTLFSQKTEEDWRTEIESPETARWQLINTGLRDGLDPDLPLVVALMRWVAQKLGIAGALDTLHNIGVAIVEWVADKIDDLHGIISGVVGNVQDKTGAFVEWLLGLLGFGHAHAGLSGIGTGQLSNVNPELMINGSFTGQVSMPEGGGWSWDSAVDHTGQAGSGSAKVVANGTLKSLLSNEIDVWGTNEITASVWVKWSGRTGSGPVSLVLNVYDTNHKLLDSVVLSGASTSSSSDWVKLSGSYTVREKIAGKTPAKACIEFQIDSAVTAGSFWFDDASLKKVNPITAELVGGFQDAMDTFVGKNKANFEEFVDALQNFDKIKTGTVLDDFIPGVGRILDNGVRGFRGLPPETDVFTHDEFLDAALAQGLSITGNGNSIQQILDRLNAAVFDEFERSALSLGDNWATPWGTGNGTLQTEGHNACLPFNWPGGNTEWATRWQGTNPSSTSDYQQNSIVLASSPQSSRLGNYVGYNDVLGRVGGATSYIRFRVGGDGSWSLSKFLPSVANANVAVEYIMASGVAGSIPAPAPGALITLFCGNKATTTLRYFKVLINNSVIFDGAEPVVANVPESLCGSSYRLRGFGMRAEGVAYLSPGRQEPGLVNYWSGADQP